MPINHRKNLDKIALARTIVAELKERRPEVQEDREHFLGLKFKKGNKVRDHGTGEEGTIIAGLRRTSTV